VADLLQSEIVSGAVQAGQRVPSERSIAEQHGLSRMTARQAVELLVRRGVVYRRPGSGTYVAPARVEHTLQRFVGFSEQMRSQGIEPSARVLSARLSDDEDADVERALGLSPGERFWVLRRVRYGDGEPLMLERTHVPESICPTLGIHDLAHGSLYDLMRSAFGVDPVRAHETIEPTACEPEDARHLSCRPGAPAMLVSRIAYDGNGRAVEHALDLYRGDRSRFVIELTS
jgi:GntR family transcriptional regulator